MDSTAIIDCPLPPDPQRNDPVESVNEKLREANEEEGEEATLRSVKKRKRDEEKEMARMAEVVMVLSTMAGMRGAKKPTAAELELVEEVKEKLAEICQGFKPSDLVDGEGIKSVFEDLGFNSNQKLGFRGPGLSIKEKFSVAKRKMEESKKFAVPSAAYALHTAPQSFVAAGENRGSPLSSVGIPAPSPLIKTSAATATAAPVTYQPVTSEVRASAAAFRLPSNQLGRDSFASPQSQVKVNSSASHPFINAPSWSRQPHPVSANMVSNHTPVKVQGTADVGVVQLAPQATRDHTFRPSIPQSISSKYPGVDQPMQGVKIAQSSPSFGNHYEIAKMVQKILQPKLPEHPTWTPPSREYMNKALTCQMCKLTVNEVETIVLCDACERGFHLKCLEAINQKGIPRAEWHCMKCLSLSNGKPLPPKYGRVMRSIAPKGPSTVSAPQSSAEKRVGSSEQKVNQDKVAASGSSNLHNPSVSGTLGNNNVESTSGVRAPNEKIAPGSSAVSSGKDSDKGKSTVTLPTSSTQSQEGICNSTSVGASSDRSNAQVSESLIGKDKSVPDSNSQPPNNVSDKNGAEHQSSRPLNDSHASNTEFPNAEVPSDTCEKNNLVEESVNASESVTLRPDVKENEQLVHASPVGSSGYNNEEGKQVNLPSDNVRNVEWVGGILKIIDEKAFYESCLIDGVSYKLHDHVLYPSNGDKLMPLKLQAMWEDIKTGSKWVIASWCYFPGDLPGSVGHPCAPESNEVYVSNHESNVLAGMIQGPCDVLPSCKYKEWSEGLYKSVNEAKNGERPVFICKWFFDELKGTFQIFS